MSDRSPLDWTSVQIAVQAFDRHLDLTIDGMSKLLPCKMTM